MALNRSRGVLSSLGSIAGGKDSSSMESFGVFGDLGLHALGSESGINDIENQHNLLSSAASQVGQVAGSSKAVLAALRALQDKIRRLDTERAAALDESTQLRQQIKNLELEMEHSKQRENLATQRVMQESRNFQERMHTEKTDLEIRLSRAEDRSKEQLRRIADLEAQIRLLTEEKNTLESTVKQGEAKLMEAEERIASGAAREKDVAQTVVWETKRHEDETEQLQAHIRSLDRALITAAEERDSLESKHAEQEEAIAKLLAVNEKLAKSLAKATKAAQMAEAEGGGVKSSRGKKTVTGQEKGHCKTGSSGPASQRSLKAPPSRSNEARRKTQVKAKAQKSGSSNAQRQQSKRSTTNLPHCAEVTTVAAEYGRVEKSHVPSEGHWVPGGLRGIDTLHMPLDLSASLQSVHSNTSAQSQDRINTSHTSSNTPSATAAAAAAGRASRDRSRSRSLGRERANSVESNASVASGDSRTSKRSVRSNGSLSAPAKDTPRAKRTDTKAATSNGTPASKAASPVQGIALNKRSRSKPSSSATSGSSASAFWDGYDVLGPEGAGVAAKGRTVHIPTAKSTVTIGSATKAARASSPAPIEEFKPRPHPLPPTVGSSDSFGNRDGDLQVVIQSLEEEFQSLNSQYRSLLKTVSSPNPVAGGKDEEPPFESDETEGALVDVIQRLHRKGEQLRKLKSPTRG